MSGDAARFDLLVVGGGINGAGIARDAAGRGLRTLLCEQHDLASHTSSASTKLIHGGLRYLEFYDFGLVRKSLREREIVLASAPHICWPLRFVLPHDAHLRPAWMIRAGLFLYDHLARNDACCRLRGRRPAQHPAGAPLESRYRTGFVYSDGWVDDARLVIAHARDAAEHGATVMTRTRCVRCAPRPTVDRNARHADGGARESRHAAVVNATGPWVAASWTRPRRCPPGATRAWSRAAISWCRSCSITSFAYIFQGPDGRIVFAIPYEHDYTLIGTTEMRVHGRPRHGEIAEPRVDYLLAMANRYFERDLTRTRRGLDLRRPAPAARRRQGPTHQRDARLRARFRHAAARRCCPYLRRQAHHLPQARRGRVDLIAPLLGCRAPHWTAGGRCRAATCHEPISTHS
jgi:glycerol-3-phosphate dehydrogenase